MAKQNNWTKYILILLVLIIALAWVSFKDKKYEHQYVPIFNVKEVTVTAFTIRKGSDEVTLVKADSTWTFAEPDTGIVKDLKVTNFFKYVVNGQREGSFITDNPDRYKQYNVDDSTATVIELKTGDQIIATLFAGRSGSSWANDHLRYPDNKNVYLSKEKILNRVGEKAKFWR